MAAKYLPVGFTRLAPPPPQLVLYPSPELPLLARGTPVLIQAGAQKGCYGAAIKLDAARTAATGQQWYQVYANRKGIPAGQEFFEYELLLPRADFVELDLHTLLPITNA